MILDKEVQRYHNYPNKTTIFKNKEELHMSKINLKGITPEAVTGVIILAVALINAVLQMCGINTLPIESEEINTIVSTAFLIVTALWNTWKNRNVTTLAQEMQVIADAVKNGEILEDEVKSLIEKISKNNIKNGLK